MESLINHVWIPPPKADEDHEWVIEFTSLTFNFFVVRCSHMKNTSPIQIVIFVVAVLALAISLVVSWFLFMRVDELEQQIAQQETVKTSEADAAQTAATSTEAEEKPAIIDPVSSKSLNTSVGIFELTHVCNGQLKEDDFRYCLGENLLIWQLQDGRVVEVARAQAGSKQQAPVLKKIWFIENQTLTDAGGALLVDFSTAYIDSPDFKDQEATYAIFSQYERILELHHFPEHGKLYWNTTGEKAVVVPMLCGGAGCEEEPISGYNLSTDTVASSLSSEWGVGIEGAQDVMGNALATWGEVSWVDSDTAHVVWQPPTGPSKTIEVSF